MNLKWLSHGTLDQAAPRKRIPGPPRPVACCKAWWVGPWKGHGQKLERNRFDFTQTA